MYTKEISQSWAECLLEDLHTLRYWKISVSTFKLLTSWYSHTWLFWQRSMRVLVQNKQTLKLQTVLLVLQRQTVSKEVCLTETNCYGRSLSHRDRLLRKEYSFCDSPIPFQMVCFCKTTPTWTTHEWFQSSLYGCTLDVTCLIMALLSAVHKSMVC